MQKISENTSTNKRNVFFGDLTDEEILKEFVRRFECDGAVLIYLDSDEEFGFGRWCNAKGKQWVRSLLEILKEKNIEL